MKLPPLFRSSTFSLLALGLLVGPAVDRARAATSPPPDHLAFKSVVAPAAVVSAPPSSPELLVRFKAGSDVAAFAESLGLSIVRPLRSDPSQYVLRADSAEEAARLLSIMRSNASVISAHSNLPSRNEPMAFVPDDPFFNAGNPAGFPGQWHLAYNARPEFDTNVRGAWDRDVTGTGVTLGVADDGVETAHPDLAPNYVAADSYDFAEDDTDPNPVRDGLGSAGDNHGTSVAGVAAARGGNALGVTGAAPLAKIAGLRLPFGGGGTVAQFVDATKYHSFGANRTIKVKNHSYGIAAPFAPNRAEREAYADSAAAGTIHSVSAGNERGKPGEDSNKKDAQASPDVITVAAFASSGRFATYSCFGANVFVTASSSSFRAGEFGVTTTDRTGDVGYNSATDGNAYPDTSFTADFGGTSSAAPLVAGIMALGVQANPAMNVRMAKHLLVRSCDVVDPGDATEESDGGWKTNGAGNRFNQNYGFGLIDADEFTRLAVEYSGVTPREEATGNLTPVGAAIPDNGELSRTFTIAATTPLEEIEIYLDISHPFRGDLEAYLTSPRGTTSRLFIRNGANDANNQGGIDWWFTANAFWGENPSGTWTLRVRDRFAGDTGTWNAFRYHARMGELIPAAAPQPPTITSFSPSSGAVGASVTIQGTKFTGATSVTFNGVAATFIIQSATQISATVPAGATTGPIRVTTPAGTALSAANFTVTPAPAITGFTPPNGIVGSLVTLAGANFTGATAVAFNGLPATQFTVDSASQITATVPAGATTGRITVTTPAGEATSAANFVVSAAPTISGFTPPAAPVGASVTIDGANFTGATSVRFNGIAAAPFNVVSPVRITANVPAGATTGPIAVTTPAGTGQSPVAFTVIPPPTIADFTPLSGAPGSAVVVSGDHFDGATQVTFNGLAADAFTVDSSAQVTAIVPGTATTGPIRITTAAGTATSAANFTVLARPANDLFANAQALTGAAGTVTGSNVGATKEAGEPNHAGNPGGKSVWFQWTAPAAGNWIFETSGSAYDTTLAVYTGDQLAALIPVAANDDTGGTNSLVTFGAAAGTVYRMAVDGSNPDPTTPTSAQSGSIRLSWSALTTPPSITGFTPASASAGARVTITGQNFAGTTNVTFGGANAGLFTVTSSAEIEATVPAGAVTGPIGVFTPAGSALSAVNFTVAAAPANDLFSNALTLTGNSGTISGSNLGAGKEAGEPDHAGNPGGRSVWFQWTAPGAGQWTFDTAGSGFDTLLAVYTGTSPAGLTVVAGNDDVPDLPGRASRVLFTASASVTYRIAIDGYAGLSGPLTLNWSFTPTAPVITGFSPQNGPVGSTVTLNGQNLAGATAVLFGGVNALFTVDSPAQITATVPAGAPTGPIRVTTPNGDAVSATSFTVLAGSANDLFSGAEPLTGSAAIVVGNNVGASKEPGEPDHAGNPGGKSIWYRWTAPSAGPWTLDTAGSQFDSILAVYTGNAVGALAEVVANDDIPGALTSEATFTATAGTVYHFAVDGYGGDAGEVVLRLYPAATPTVLYSTEFEVAQGFSTAAPLDGQSGWIKLGTGGNGVVDGLFPGRGQQAYIGSTAPDTGDSTLYLWRPLNHTPNTNTLPIVRFSVLMGIVDSENGSYDGFHWSVYDPDANLLFELAFDNSSLDVFYGLSVGDYVNTGVTFQNGIIYEFEVLMDFARNRWRAMLDGTVLAADQPIAVGTTPRTIGDIDAVWNVLEPGFPGDNFMLFDNFRVTAEENPGPRIVLQPQSRSVLAGTNVTFGVVATGEQPLAYQWQRNSTNLPGATNALLTLNRVIPAQAGAYVVTVSNAFGTAVSTPATLTVNQPTPPSLTVGSFSPATGFTFTVNGTPGVRYAIDASTNLIQWVDLGLPPNTNGTFTITDPAAATLSRRFYRARETP